MSVNLVVLSLRGTWIIKGRYPCQNSSCLLWEKGLNMRWTRRALVMKRLQSFIRITRWLAHKACTFTVSRHVARPAPQGFNRKLAFWDGKMWQITGCKWPLITKQFVLCLVSSCLKLLDNGRKTAKQFYWLHQGYLFDWNCFVKSKTSRMFFRASRWSLF